jgi:hypothetical protein
VRKTSAEKKETSNRREATGELAEKRKWLLNDTTLRQF